MIELPNRVHDHALASNRFPVCVYDLDRLDERTRRVRAYLPTGVELYYHVNAALGTGIVDALSSRVDGFEVTSGDALEQVRAATSSAPIAVCGPGKTTAELSRSIATPGVAVLVESPDELRFLSHMAEADGRDVDVLLRVCPQPGTVGPPALFPGLDAFGMDPASLVACAAILDANPRVRLHGFAVHVAHPMAADDLGVLTLEMLTVLRTWSTLLDVPDPQYVIGGGMTDESFDWARYGRSLAGLIRDGETLRIVADRSLTANCGWYLTRVIDVKHTYGRAFAVVTGFGAAGSDFTVVSRDDPAAWDAPWPRPALKTEHVLITGRSSASRETPARGVNVNRLRPGDVLAFTLPETPTPAPPVHYVTGTSQREFTQT